MRVLWVNNIAIPKISADIGENAVPVGGWMVKLADEISKMDNIELYILFPHRETVAGTADNIKYTGFPPNSREGERVIKKTIQDFCPDVVHVFGTEYRHTYVVVCICKELGIIDHTVISIQGLTSVYARHYTAFLDHKIVNGKTARDVLKGNVKKNQQRFVNSGESEIKALKMVKHVIGRTDWDRAAVYYINPAAQYHFNNEMLRDSFYKSQWDINKCDRHSIFFSQATSPIKGLHLMLDALLLLKDKYPDVKLSIAGKSYTEKERYKLSYYEKYVIGRIKEEHLEDNVRFTGFLDEKQMCRKYLSSHVFASASSIENSPNSVCEAMILGVPTVSSMVGGVANLMTHGEDGFYYQADAPYMLAYYIDRIFSDDELAFWLSKNARKRAMKRHEPKAIVEELVHIYEEISRERANLETGRA